MVFAFPHVEEDEVYVYVNCEGKRETPIWNYCLLYEFFSQIPIDII